MNLAALDEQEHAATLEVALAFIDEFDSEADNNSEGGTSTGFDCSSRSVAFESVSSPAAASLDKQSRRGDGGNPSGKECQRTRRKNREANTKSVRRYRKRNKDEIQELRAKIFRMEAQHARLRHKHDRAQYRQVPALLSKLVQVTTNPLVLQIYGNLLGIDRAVSELRQRQESESLNRQLKDALAAYAAMGDGIECLLQKTITRHDLNALFGFDKLQIETIARSSPETSDLDLRVFVDLQQDLNQLFLSTTVMTGSSSKKEFNQSRVRDDSECGQVYEFTANTPLACNFQYLEKLASSHISKKIGEQFTLSEDGRKTSFEKQFSIVFSSPQFGQFRLDGMSAFDKFDVSGRSTVACASRLRLRGTELVFHEQSWITLSDTSGSVDTPGRSMFQVEYQIFAEADTNTTVRGTYPSQLCAFILNTQMQRMRAHQLEVQNALLYELDAIEREGRPRTPLLIECPAKHTYSE